MKICVYFKLFVFGVCLFLLSACKSDSTEPGYTILDIESVLNGKPTSIPNLIIRSVIPLETNDQSLIGEITRLDFYDNRFFIFDRHESKTLFIFNSKGEFQTKTDLGRGPGELLNPWDFYIDKEKSQVIVFDQATFNLLTYDIDLNFISSNSYPGLCIRSFKKLNEDTVLVFAQHHIVDEREEGLSPTLYNYLIYSNDFSKIIKKISPYSKEFSGLPIYSPMSTNSNKVLFVELLNSTIYYVDNNLNIQILYHLDFGEFTVSEKDKKNGVDYTFRKVRAGQRIGSLDYVFDNDNFLVTSFFFKNMFHFVIYCKEKNEIYFSNNLFMNGLLPICSVQGLNETGFIGVVNPKDLISFLEKRNIPDIHFTPDIFDNQYLILFEIIK